MSAPLGLNQLLPQSRVWVIWSDLRDEPRLTAIVQQCLSLECRVTVISALAAGANKLGGQDARSVYEWLTPSDDAAVFRAAYELAGQWHAASPVNESLMWNGIQLGRLLEGILPLSFVGALRQVAGALKWIEHECPDVVILTRRRDQTATAFQQVMEREKIAVIFAEGERQDQMASLLETIQDRLSLALLDIGDVLVRGIWARLLHIYHQLSGRKDSRQRPTAIFVGFDRNHYKHILPVAEYLKQWQALVLQGLVGKTLFVTPNARRPGLAARTADEYATAGAWLRYGVARRRIRSLWEQLDHNGALADSFIYQGVRLWPLVRKHLRYCFYVYLPTAIRYLELAARIIDQESPSIFVFGNDSCHRGIAIITAARQRDIPTLTIQHGITANPWGYIPRSDKMIVWGEYSRTAIAACGIARERLICAGAPGLDPLMSLAADETLLAQRRMAACRQLGVAASTPLVLFLTSAVADEYQAPIVRMVFQVAQDLRLEGRFVVKLHPHESGKLQERLAAEIGFRPRIVREIDLWGIVAASQVVITFSNSTAGLEALILRKPVIAVESGGYQSIYANTSGLVRQVACEDDLKASLEHFLSENFTPDSAALEWFLGPLDGKATVRAASVVAALAGNTQFDAHKNQDADAS